MTHMSERWGSVLTVLVTRVSIVDLSSGRRPWPEAWGGGPVRGGCRHDGSEVHCGRRSQITSEKVGFVTGATAAYPCDARRW